MVKSLPLGLVFLPLEYLTVLLKLLCGLLGGKYFLDPVGDVLVINDFKGAIFAFPHFPMGQYGEQATTKAGSADDLIIGYNGDHQWRRIPFG
jgi:hypothetical protein